MKYYVENEFAFLNGEVGTAVIAVDEEGNKVAYTVEIDEDGDYFLVDVVEGIDQDEIEIDDLSELDRVFRK